MHQPRLVTALSFVGASASERMRASLGPSCAQPLRGSGGRREMAAGSLARYLIGSELASNSACLRASARGLRPCPVGLAQYAVVL